MKKILLSIFSALFPILLLAQAQPTASEKAAQETVVNMFSALSDLNTAHLGKYCTTDVTLYENGQVWNLDSLVKKAITPNIGNNFKRTNKFEFINTTINENTAWVTYHLYSDMQKGERKGSVHWMETVILVKENKEWKIKVLHSTLIKRS